MERLFSMRERLWRRAADMLAPLGERGGLGGFLAGEAEDRALEAAMRLPDRVWRRLDRLDRARLRAALKRIVSTTGERARLCEDADAYVDHARTVLAAGLPVPFLFAAGPVGGESVFRLLPPDVERFAKASPLAWEHFVASLAAWAEAPAYVRFELVGELVGTSTELGLAISARRPATEEEQARARSLARALVGEEPAASTDAELATALCRAYLAGSLHRGDEATFESIRERPRNV